MNKHWCASPYRASSNTPHQGGTRRTTRNAHYQGQSLEKLLTSRIGKLQDKYTHLSTFNDDQQEELLELLRNCKIKIDGTGTATSSGRINDLRTMLLEKKLREFDELALSGNLTANHLKHITEGLLYYFPPLNALYN